MGSACWLNIAEFRLGLLNAAARIDSRLIQSQSLWRRPLGTGVHPLLSGQAGEGPSEVQPFHPKLRNSPEGR